MDRLTNIIAAVDFSPCSEVALRQAARIAAWNKARLSAVHVLDIPMIQPAPPVLLSIDMPTHDMLNEDAKAHWAQFAPDMPAKKDVAFDTLFGTPGSELARAAEERGADLLVVGAVGLMSRARGIGSTAGGCIRRAPCKVLAVREGHTRPFSAVAACVDFSPTSLEALSQAVRVAAQDNAALHVVHAYDNPWKGMSRPESVRVNMPDFDAKMQAAVEARLREFAAPLAHELGALRAHYHAVQQTSQREGHGKGLISFITQHGIDLAVLGVRSRWNVRDFLLGSTAERICRDADCSILTIRPVADGPKE